jgi:uncharacterized protein
VTASETSESPPKNPPANRDWIAYVLPMALFMIITALVEPYAVKQFVPIYCAKVVLVTAALFATYRVWKGDVQISLRGVIPGIIIGLLIIWLWIVLDPYTPQLKLLGSRTEYNPYKEIASPIVRNVFLGFRFFGLVIMVPIMEEIFWRSFLIRYITNENFRQVPMGTFSAGAFAAVAIAFALAHPEWLAALICAILLGVLLKYTRSLWACIVAHAVANLVLGIYVVQTQQWKFW